VPARARKSRATRATPESSGASGRALDVPAFYLYGENWTSESFGLFHIEALAVRNVPNNWRIGLHRHPDFHQLSITFAGGCAFEHDGVAATASGPCCVFTPANVVHKFTYQPDSIGYVISVSSDFVAGLMLDDGPIKASVSKLTALRLLTLHDEASAERLLKLVSLIAETFAADRGRARETLRYLFGACLLELHALIAPVPAADEDEACYSADTHDLFSRFRE